MSQVSTLQELCRRAPASSGDASLEDHWALLQAAAALLPLLRDEGLVLCGPSAARLVDALLTLVSSLRAGEAQGGPDAARLGEAVTQALETLAALLQGRAPAGAEEQKQHQDEEGRGLAGIAQALGFGPADAQAAQQRLAARSVAALWGGPASSSGEESPLEAVLRAAVAMPQRCGGAPPMGMHAAAARLLPALRQFPLARCGLSQRGWEAYWLLEPQALWQTLAEVLEAAASGPGGGGEACAVERVRSALPAQPHWAALAPALAVHPALHLAARQALHAWVGASGSAAAWALQVALVDAARAAHGAALAQGALPPELQALYPPSAQRLALFLHTVPPEPEGLPRLAELLSSGEPAKRDGSGRPGGPAPGGWEEQAWRALLDRPGWLRCALSQLPLEGGDAVPLGSGQGQGGGGVLAAAADVAAWALLPQAATLRRALAEALRGDLEDCDPAALRPWLATLRRWQALWADVIFNLH